MIGAVLFDLDDTLYPHSAWLDGAWSAVAARAETFGVPPAAFEDALRAVAANESDRVIDRALAGCGFPDVPVAPLAETFRAHSVSTLEPYPGVREGLALLSSAVPVAVVTDGDPRMQRAKLHALDFRVKLAVCSDEIGREFRKPHPFPFKRAAVVLRVRTDDCVFVGDHPETDIAGANAVGMRTVRVRTGEYAHMQDDAVPWRRCETAAEAMRMLHALIAAGDEEPADRTVSM